MRVSGIVNPTGTTNNVLNLTRGDLSGNVYGGGLDFSAGVLHVSKLIGATVVETVLSTDAGQGNQPPLTELARSYFLQVDVIGNQVTARVFDVEGGTQLLIVNYTDTGVGGPPLTSGIAGVSAITTGGPVDATFGPVGAVPLP